MNNTRIVGYEGRCPICGSSDGIIVKGEDSLYRNVCRVLGCPCYYKPAPAEGFTFKEDCENPFETDYLKSGTVTVGEYLNGRKPMP